MQSNQSHAPTHLGGAEAPAATKGRRPPTRAWLQPALVALTILTAFIAAYIGLQRDPQPHGIPVSVTGNQLAHAVSAALEPGAEVTKVATPAAARETLERHQAVASLSQDGPGSALHLEVAGANGQSTTAVVTSLVRTYAEQSDQQLIVDDAVPLDQHDARGLAGFYLSFGVTLAGFVLAQNVLGLTKVLRLRHRFTLIAGFSAAAGLLAATLAGPVLGAVPAPVIPLALVLALLAAAAAFTTKLLGTYLGPIGVPAATLLLLTVGNATSGAVIGADLLPGIARSISAALPPGAAVRAIADLSYFQGSGAITPMITLATWAISAGLLVAVRSRTRATRATA